MLVFLRPPKAHLLPSTGWQDARAVSAWLGQHGFSPLRQHGGLALSPTARDPHAAAHIAAAVADRLRARSAVGSRGETEIMSEIYVAGCATPIPTARSRRAEVRALERERTLLEIRDYDSVDQALELLSHLNTASAPVAAAAGWAAVESLLSGPGDEEKIVTAERLANLVACSWPRAELTTIAWAIVRQPATTGAMDALAESLRACTTNQQRSERVLGSIRAGKELQMARPADQLAVRRMQRLVRAPRTELLSVRERAGEALRRLYRQRNLVVHGGQTAGFGLAAALRTAAPLVGAGLDRITHASLVDGIRPLELAARAQVEIERAGTTGSPALTNLLS